jgi:hypothetical protein
LKEKNLLA